MATIKSFTSLEQSRKLTYILPLESADMCWKNGVFDKYIQCFTPFVIDENGTNVDFDYDVPCWSLTALLNVLPNGIVMNKDSQNGKYHFSSEYIGTYITADNPVDACVAMVEKLHELNLL